jgi:hypothetical protein
MLSILKDLVAHINPIGSINLLRVTQKGNYAAIDGFNDQKTLIVFAKTIKSLDGFSDVFGIGDFSKLSYILKTPEYQNGAKIEIKTEVRNGETVPVEVSFQNQTGDFKNVYKFVNPQIVKDKLKDIGFSEPNWDVTFSPSALSIGRLKLMAGGLTEENVFKFKTKDNNLMLIIGDPNTHGGEFVFHPGISKNINEFFFWPIDIIMAILNTDGDKEISISNEGLVRIKVNSGLIEYNYMIPAQQK